MRKPLIVAVAVCAALGPVTAPAAAGPAVGPVPAAATAGLRSYFVITAPKQTASAADATRRNGGTVYASYDAIGVLVAHSTDTAFAAKMRTVGGVQKVGATRTSDVPAAAADPALPAAPSQRPVTTQEVSRPDMTQIGADRAWKVNPGSPAVTVAVLDTGVDDQHADLQANFDAGRSASCAYGRVDTRPGAWRAIADHGTHVAGTIAAARNDRGMVGVAPGVKISSIRVAEAGSQLFFPENTVCAFVFAADRRVSITNNSYYVDPWLFTCPDDLDQDAIAEAVRRSVAYAEANGVVNIAAAGNESYDLSAKSGDETSPNDSTPARRTISNSCLSLPTELPGVLVVASVDAASAKSRFSNYGTGKISVAAPGEAVYSTVPGGAYASQSGTSMAAPHVAGVAALIRSTDPKATPAQVRARLAAQADDLPCPAAASAECTGSAAVNSFYGQGLVDAAEAVGAAGKSQPAGVTISKPSEQLGIGGLPAIPLQLKASSRAGELGYSASGLPPGLRMDRATGWVTGVLTPGSGRYKVTVTARDGQSGSARTTFFWNVWSF